MLLAAIAAFTLSAAHHPKDNAIARTTPALAVSRLDQASRRLTIGGLRPGQRVSVLAGRTSLGSTIASGSRATLYLARALRPGTAVTVVADERGRLAARSTTTVQNDYLQYHYDAGKTGWNAAETALTTANVNNKTFGHLFSLPVDAFSYAQPLFMSGLSIGGSPHNVVFVATENDSVYAFDSDTGAQLWMQNYANPGAGAIPIPAQYTNAQNIIPAVGITSTPAIDPDTQTMYFVAAIQQSVSGGFTYHQYLHAVDVTTGLDRMTPADITATAHLNNGKKVVFDALSELNRASTLLANGSVYVSFGNHDDTATPSTKPHGWIFQYDAATLSLQSFFNTTLDVSTKYDGDIWAGGWGPAIDGSGNLFFATGDGPFDGNTGGANWGDTVMKMTPALSLLDYFTPFDQSVLSQKDHDLGSGGVMVLPDQPGTLPHLAVAAGEEGTIYLLNRDNLGQYTAGGPDNVVQSLTLAIHKFTGGPAYYVGPNGQYVYYCGNGDPVHAFQLTTSPAAQLTLVGTAPSSCGASAGATPVVSSNGSTAGSGIVWITTRPPKNSNTPFSLRAYDATNVSKQLVNIGVSVWQNFHNPPFSAPTVIGGRVFVDTSNSVEEYGLLGTTKRRM